MLKGVVKMFGGDPNKKAIEENIGLVNMINEMEEEFEKLSDETLAAKTNEFKQRISDGESLDDLLVEAFAAVREASKRTIGLRHYDVQLIGGIVLHQGKVAEMRTGEGKTLVATLPIYLNALEGKGVHLITVNDYLARRDARWMAPIYNLLGMSVGVLQMAARTENARKAFLVDLDKEAAQEDQHQLILVPRQEAYLADITYGTNNEFGFDYLRDNMAMRMERRSQRGHHYAIIDEVDNVLIDEARTPLIISGPAHDDTENYAMMASLVKRLKPHDYEVNERDRTVTLTEIGEVSVERMLGQPLRDPERPEDVTPEQARLMGFLEQALRAQFLFRRNKEYLVQAGKVIIIDENTGRLMPGRRWSDGLHQAVEAKEGVKVEAENVTYATITIQNYFRMYEKLSGMTGTALTEAEEFDKIYSLDVLSIPPNVEYNATIENAPLITLEAEDELGYRYTYYSFKEDEEKLPVFWKRKDYPDVVYRTEEIKMRAIAREILTIHVIGRPILIGTTSVENSERLSNRLRAEPIRQLAHTLLIRDAWFEKNNREEDGRLIMELSFLNEPLEKIENSRMRQVARDLGISLNPESEDNLNRLMNILGLETGDKERLTAALAGGIPHQVLNARKHTEESQIIAGAGEFGAVTIATNMAGRGVDIKLGGDIAEELVSTVNRVLKRAGYEEPYDMTMEARKEALLKLSPEEYGIYDSEVKFFLKSMEDMVKVKELGGLHVIGSERHSARRIDNQLRGRSARQGDPGSSRFYLSMEDELMRLFGGQQMDIMMQRLKVDDAMPLEMGLVSKVIEGAQTRVEGANFDRRKHVLEYDDVLNSQRETIYGQRDRIFKKDDLSDDVGEMLEVEVSRRVPEALEDEEGPWRLLAWLEQIQPTFSQGEVVFPSFSLKLLVDYVLQGNPSNKQELLGRMMELVAKSLDAQEEHLLGSAEQLMDALQDALDRQLEDRMEILDTFMEGLRYLDETDTRSNRELVNELSNQIRLPLNLSNEQLRQFKEDPEEIVKEAGRQLEESLTQQILTRLSGALERRIEAPLEIDMVDLAKKGWDKIHESVFDAIKREFEQRKEILIGDGESGQIARDLSQAIEDNAAIDEKLVIKLLVLAPQGKQASFDKKTHRRVFQMTKRLVYDYFASDFLQEHSTEEITAMVLDHLKAAQKAFQKAWGASQWAQIKGLKYSALDAPNQERLEAALAGIDGDQWKTALIGDMNKETEHEAIIALGKMSLNEIYRELLLRVISDLWVDYLTRIEALRISIGLEAYAQRDPLTEYKAKATQMFQTLISDMRLGVVSRMFTFAPRKQAAVQEPEKRLAAETAPTQTGREDGEKSDEAPKAKRRRRRRRKKKTN